MAFGRWVSKLNPQRSGGYVFINYFFNNLDLSNSILDIKDLYSVNFMKSNLSNVSFIKANLENANLREANLENANLRHADLREVDLREVNLELTNLNNKELKLLKRKTTLKGK